MTNEIYLAGCILREEFVICGLDGLVAAEDFQIENCRAIYEAARAIATEGGIVDPVTVRERAARNGVDLSREYLAELMECVPTTANFAEYGRRVAEDAHKRRVKALAESVQLDDVSTADELLERLQRGTGELSEGRQTKRSILVTSAIDLQRAELPPTVFQISGILPEGTNIISAASKIGKSWMVLDIGLSVASGKPFMGHETKQCGVLYLALEDSLSRLQDRMNKVLAGDSAPKDFFFATEVPTLDNGLLDDLDAHLQQNPNTRLIIIDTLQKIRGRALPRESSYEQDYREMGMVKSHFDKKGVSVLFVHHNRKMKDESDPFNMISGTNGIMGAADTIWAIIKEKRTDNEATLHITGRDVAQSDTVISFDKTVWKWKPVGAADLIASQRDKQAYDNNPIVKTIKELLKKNGEWKGSAGELLIAGKQICKHPIAVSAQSLGYALRDLDGKLLDYDGIAHQKASHGTAGNKHFFFFQHWTDAADHVEQMELLPV